uniref:Uncharacterized protein n=1 Tax=Anguilla anguilla TaxID=7936 RepID=A0A0E9SXV4_ANGAN
MILSLCDLVHQGYSTIPHGPTLIKMGIWNKHFHKTMSE